MKFDLVSLFPNFFNSPLQESLIAKAIEKKLIQVQTHNLRNYCADKAKQVDDAPYGGGAGMVLKPEVLAKAVQSLKKQDSLVILADPSGVKFNQALAKDLSQKEHLILISGRYEGVDQRFKERYVDMEISVGDYVLNGGESACLMLVETIARLVPGVIGSSESLEFESFSTSSDKSQLLEYPQYTRPSEFEGEKVPDILLSGDHEKIAQWRLTQAKEKTQRLRPDLLKD